MNKQNNKNPSSSEQLMEAFYSYIGECHLENIANELNSKKEEIDQLQVPNTLNEWFKDYIEGNKKEEKKRKRRKQLRKISSRVALIFFALLVSLTILTVSVEAIRVKVLNFFTEKTEKYTSFKVDEEASKSDSVAITWDNFYYPMYLPEGFRLESAEEFNTTKIIQFTNVNGESIQFVQAPNGTDIQLDTENSNTSEVMINNATGILIQKENKNILFWSNNEMSFYIISSIDANEIIDVSKSIEKK